MASSLPMVAEAKEAGPGDQEQRGLYPSIYPSGREGELGKVYREAGAALLPE